MSEWGPAIAFGVAFTAAMVGGWAIWHRGWLVKWFGPHDWRF